MISKYDEKWIHGQLTRLNNKRLAAIKNAKANKSRYKRAMWLRKEHEYDAKMLKIIEDLCGYKNRN